MNKIFLIFLFLILHCGTVDPKFELTTEPTAMERQIIGEDKELEKDGWLISSIKTSSIGNENWKKDAEYYDQIGFEDKKYGEVLKVIFYLSPEIHKYKSIGILGEGLDGLVHYIDKSSVKMDFNIEKIKQIVKLNNDARVRIYETKVLANSKNKVSESELKLLKEKFLLENYNLAEKGEYIEKTKNVWIKK